MVGVRLAVLGFFKTGVRPSILRFTFALIVVHGLPNENRRIEGLTPSVLIARFTVHPLYPLDVSSPASVV
jgi:hypothetical protein